MLSKKNMKTLLSFFIIVAFASCIKEQQTNYEAYLVNKTSYNISIFFYRNGLAYPKDTINLSPSQRFFFGRGFERGINVSPGFTTKYNNNDSIIVKYNNQYAVTH